MARKELLFLALMFCAVKRNTGQPRPVVFSINPETLKLSPNNSSNGGQVVITCKDSTGPGLENVLFYNLISILRQLPDQNESLLGALSYTNREIRGPTNIPGATVVGNFTERSLVLTMPNTRCADAGNYTCRMVYQKTDLNVVVVRSEKSFEVEVVPGPINLVVEPSGKSEWLVNETLLIRCNGALGTVDDTTTIEWVWEYAYKTNDVLGTWTGLENASDIKTDPMSQGGECYKQQVSHLTRKLQESDTDRVYRCYVKRNGISYTQFAQMVEVGTVTEEPITTTPSTADENTGTSKASLGGIIGGVIGALVAIIVVVIIIVIILKKRRSKQGQPAAEVSEDKESGPYTVPDNTYSQPNRFRNSREPQGVTNKGMDELTEKPSPRDHRPPRYANDFHQGHRNQAYDYNPEPNSHGSRHYSSEDDGTDSRVNTSHASFGQGDPTIGTPI